MQIPPMLTRYRDDIENEMRKSLPLNGSMLGRMMRYHLGWTDPEGNETVEPSGKALRPSLCLLACEATGGSHRPALPAAAAVELVHNYSLIHDDVQDNDEERRHRPTVWKVWGKAQAINAGTAMRIIAGRTLFRLADQGIAKGIIMSSMELIDGATLQLLEGQYSDIDFEGRSNITIGEYLAMVRGKTASLLACAAQTGALVGSGDAAKADQFREFGEHLGMAFQVRDDILGIWGDPVATGKPLGSDIIRKKKSLPVIMAFAGATGNAAALLESIYRKTSLSSADAEKVMGIMNDLPVRHETERMAQRFHDQAAEALERISLKHEHRADLEALLRFLAERKH